MSDETKKKIKEEVESELSEYLRLVNEAKKNRAEKIKESKNKKAK